MASHHAVIRQIASSDPDVPHIRADCDCGGWIEFVVDVEGRTAGSVSFNGYPPCPAIAVCAREYGREIRAFCS